jgi:hypothetical protein
LRAGAGWCHEDQAEDNGFHPDTVDPRTLSRVRQPLEHNQHTEESVRIRYLDREAKFQ